MDPVVWALDDQRLRNYLVPRDCPRVTYQRRRKALGFSRGDRSRCRPRDEIAPCSMQPSRLPMPHDTWRSVASIADPLHRI
jgi:hypothetical protein